MKQIKIGNHIISDSSEPYIIAEMSGNHNRSLEKALKIIDAAAESGAHAIKLQTYTPDTITMPGVYKIEDPDSLWNGYDLYELYKVAYTPWEWHKALFERAREKNITIFSTPFDETAVDLLEELGAPAYKIASFENNHIPLLKKVAKTGKPVIMSTGTSTLSMIDEAVKTLRENGAKDIILLKCTSTYPADPEDSNLLTIPYLKEIFGTIVGLSDHTLGIGVAVASVALGARVIEKHFILDRSEGGVDAAFSLEPQEMKLLVEETRRAFKSLGKVHLDLVEKEKKSIFFKRSIFASKDIKKGEKFSEENLKIIRPNLGLPPKYYEILIGKTAKQDIKKGTPITWDIIL